MMQEDDLITASRVFRERFGDKVIFEIIKNEASRLTGICQELSDYAEGNYRKEVTERINESKKRIDNISMIWSVD